MARQEVIQIRCDRCKRVQLLPKQEHPKTIPDFEARFFDKKLLYEDLCSLCKETIQNLWEDLEQWERAVKQPFGPTIQGETAAPLDVAPNYKPPQPHSAAAKR